MAEPPYSLEEFWTIVRLLAGDMKKCGAGLEIVEKNESMDEDMIRFWRKMYAYTLFALIEGATYHLMYIAFVARNSRDVVFTLEEMKVLEDAYDFDEDREIEPGLTEGQMLERIKFAFNAFARVHYSDYILPNDRNGWAGIKLAFSVKSGILHPQSAAELEVFDEHVTDMAHSVVWFMQCLVEMMESCRKSAEEKLASWSAEKNEPIM